MKGENKCAQKQNGIQIATDSNWMRKKIALDLVISTSWPIRCVHICLATNRFFSKRINASPVNSHSANVWIYDSSCWFSLKTRTRTEFLLSPPPPPPPMLYRFDWHSDLEYCAHWGLWWAASLIFICVHWWRSQKRTQNKTKRKIVWLRIVAFTKQSTNWRVVGIKSPKTDEVNFRRIQME